MRIPIVFSTDHNFVMPTGVTIHSLLKHANPENTFEINVIIDSDVTEEDKDSLKKQVGKDCPDSCINFINIGDTFEKGYEIRGISRACYNRLLIPWLFPQYDKVIYSDVDIIFRVDISPVFSFDLEPYLVAGIGGEVWNKGLIKKYLEKIGADSSEYINSGFLLINSKKQRQQNLKEKYIELSQKKFLYQDQDIINLVCKGKIGHLPKVYNLKPVDIYQYEPGQIKVVHFIGLKPWNSFTYGWRYWWNEYEESCFYDAGLEKKVSGRILRWNEELKKIVKTSRQKIKFLIKVTCIK